MSGKDVVTFGRRADSGRDHEVCGLAGSETSANVGLGSSSKGVGP